MAILSVAILLHYIQQKQFIIYTAISLNIDCRMSLYMVAYTAAITVTIIQANEGVLFFCAGVVCGVGFGEENKIKEKSISSDSIGHLYT